MTTFLQYVMNFLTTCTLPFDSLVAHIFSVHYILGKYSSSLLFLSKCRWKRSNLRGTHLIKQPKYFLPFFFFFFFNQRLNTNLPSEAKFYFVLSLQVDLRTVLCPDLWDVFRCFHMERRRLSVSRSLCNTDLVFLTLSLSSINWPNVVLFPYNFLFSSKKY